ncbi:MAG: serine hydrolase [Phycisphaerales bacterium]|nr:serine hydrolase [Planctomycetota bacterium]
MLVACAAGSLLAPAPAIGREHQRAQTAAAYLTGSWSGAITVPGMKLEIQLEFASPTEGTISIPVQKLRNIPLEKISVDAATPAHAVFKIKETAGIGGDPTFTGAFSEDGLTLSGDFSQGGGKFPFEVRKAQPASGESVDVLEGFDAFIDQARQAWDVPGVAVAVIKGDKVVFARGFGYRDVDKKLPVSENTLFAIGSATKAFTTFVMGQLADEGKLDFDKPVISYIPEFRLYDRSATERMTPRDLVTHRSGLPRHDLLWYGNTSSTREDLMHKLAYLPNNKDLREAWQYNNLMFLTAGVLEERLTGKSWEENIRARILLPLGMNRTTFSVVDSQKDADFSLGYRKDEDTDKVERIDFRDIATMGPAGSINSSVSETANWVRLHLSDGTFAGKRLIQESTLQDLHAPHMSMGDGSPESPEVVPVGYGMGWFVDVYRGHRRIHHGGNIDGFSALVAFFPQDDVGFVVLTNMNGSALPGMIVRHGADRMLKLPREDWSQKALEKRKLAEKQGKKAKENLGETRKSGTHPSHPLAEYAGDYEHPGYGVISVTVDNSSSSDPALAFAYNGIRTPLEHWHYDVFSGKKNEKDQTFESFKLLFETGLDGEIDALRAPMEPAEEPFVFKRKGDSELFDKAFLSKLAGDYVVSDTQPCTISLSGDTLTASLPGQPTYQLVPGRHRTFRLKELEGFSIQFVLENDAVQELRFVQPNGVFKAKPAKK